MDEDSNVLAGPFKFSACSKFVPRVFAENPQAMLHHFYCTSGIYLQSAMDLLRIKPQPSRVDPPVTEHIPHVPKENPAAFRSPRSTEGNSPAPTAGSGLIEVM